MAPGSGAGVRLRGSGQGSGMGLATKGIAPLLRAVHNNLDQPLRLASLARQSGYSPFHFHRRFVAVVGETPMRHVSRLRLERAAYLLAISDEPVLAVALQVGFEAHETFTRAFRRHFGVPPTAYRRAAKAAQQARLKRNASFIGEACRLSSVRFLTLPPGLLLGTRRTGAYETLPMPPLGEHDAVWVWAPVVAWARQTGVTCDVTPWAICLDDPTLTPGPQQRLDACLPLLDRPSNKGPFALQRFTGGLYAGVEHVGPHATIDQAYRHVADGVRRSTTVAFAVGPPVQIVRHLDRDPHQHRTEVYFPVVRQRRRARNVKQSDARARTLGP
jgi:AraC family transcriptional regulator